jgi:hypothetical protein
MRQSAASALRPIQCQPPIVPRPGPARLPAIARIRPHRPVLAVALLADLARAHPWRQAAAQHHHRRGLTVRPSRCQGDEDERNRDDIDPMGSVPSDAPAPCGKQGQVSRRYSKPWTRQNAFTAFLRRGPVPRAPSPYTPAISTRSRSQAKPPMTLATCVPTECGRSRCRAGKVRCHSRQARLPMRPSVHTGAERCRHGHTIPIPSR